MRSSSFEDGKEVYMIDLKGINILHKSLVKMDLKVFEV